MLRAIARVAIVVGAVGAVALMLYIGRRNQHYWLLVLFAAWDAAPFLALGVADLYGARWPAATRATLYIVTLIVTAGSLAFYTDVVVRPRPQPAAMFLMIPVWSWLLMLTAIPAANYLSRSRTSRS
jgi:hypothetical protein